MKAIAAGSRGHWANHRSYERRRQPLAAAERGGGSRRHRAAAKFTQLSQQEIVGVQRCDIDVVERHLLAGAEIEEHVAAYVLRVCQHRREIGGTSHAVQIDLVSAFCLLQSGNSMVTWRAWKISSPSPPKKVSWPPLPRMTSRCRCRHAGRRCPHCQDGIVTVAAVEIQRERRRRCPKRQSHRCPRPHGSLGSPDWPLHDRR